MASLGGLFSPYRPLATAQIISVEPSDPTNGPVGGIAGNVQSQSIFKFQYWPETLSDSKGVEYAEKAVPGGSHPLYQWIRGGARRLAMLAVFSNELNPEMLAQFSSTDASKYSVDINAAVWALRRFIYPSYGTSDFKAFPPEFLQLQLPNTAIGGYDRGGPNDIMNAIMTRCDVEYRAWFQDGTPRYATIDLEFAEVVQGDPRESSAINFKDRNNFSAAWDQYLSNKIMRFGPRS